MIGLLLFIAAGLGGVTWWSLLKGKEKARVAASLACREHGLVLMDDTVMLASVQLNKRGHSTGWCLRYRFEFARRGVLHRAGSVLVTPGHKTTVVIKTSDGQLIQDI